MPARAGKRGHCDGSAGGLHFCEHGCNIVCFDDGEGSIGPGVGVAAEAAVEARSFEGGVVLAIVLKGPSEELPIEVFECCNLCSGQFEICDVVVCYEASKSVLGVSW